jgi:hypothetical protein
MVRAARFEALIGINNAPMRRSSARIDINGAADFDLARK